MDPNNNLGDQIFPKYNSGSSPAPQTSPTPSAPLPTPPVQVPPQKSKKAPLTPEKIAEKKAYRTFALWNTLILILLIIAYMYSFGISQSSPTLAPLIAYTPFLYILVMLIIGGVYVSAGNPKGHFFFRFVGQVILAVFIALLIGFGACLLLLWGIGSQV
jgi:hypothetical protein